MNMTALVGRDAESKSASAMGRAAATIWPAVRWPDEQKKMGDQPGGGRGTLRLVFTFSPPPDTLVSRFCDQ
jgi:hypothetical protein